MSSPQSSISNMSSRSASPTSNNEGAGTPSVTPSPPKQQGDFPRSFSRGDSGEKLESSDRSGSYRSPTYTASNGYRLDTSGGRGEDARHHSTTMSLGPGGIVADAGVLAMMEDSAAGISRGMYSGTSTPVSHHSRKKPGVVGGSVAGGGRHLRVNSRDFDDNLSVASDATDKQVGGRPPSRDTAKLHNQEMVDVSVDQEYGEFGETDPYSYKARKTLWGSSINTRDGILRDHGLAVFTTRRQKIRYYSIFACMMISLVVIIGVSVTITQPKRNDGDDDRPPLPPPTTTATTTTTTDEETGNSIGTVASDASSSPNGNMCDYDIEDEKSPKPTPQLQCYCDGYISQWTEEQLGKYENLQTEWLGSFYDGEFEFSPDSCHPHNVALAWLASDDVNYDSPEFFFYAKDRFALAVLFQEWGGFDWTNNDKWLSTDSLCDWYGVECDNTLKHRVKELHLTENNLSGELQPELAWLENLSVLDLGQNHLEGTIPKELFTQMDSLEVLCLSVNKLQGTIPREVGELVNLVELKLDLNLFAGTLPKELGTCTSLEVLQLWDNQFTGPFGSEHIGDMSALRDLLIHNNKFTGTLSAQWAVDAPHLMNLDVSATELGGSLPTEFGLWSDLVRLNVQDLELEGNVPSEVTSLPKLQTLDLSENHLKGSLPDGNYYGKALEFLLLGDNDLEGTIPTQLGGLPLLQTLELRNNNLEGVIPTELASIATLSSINLSGNPHLEGPVPPQLCDLRSSELRSLVTSCGLECDIPACCTQCA